MRQFGPVRKEKQFGLPDYFCKIHVTILSRMSHPASGFPVVFRELKQRRRRRLLKNNLFYQRNSRTFRFVQYVNGSKNLLRFNMQRQCTVPNGNAKNQPSSSTFRRRHRTWSSHVVVSQRKAKKCTKSYNALVQLLFCSLNNENHEKFLLSEEEIIANQLYC